MLAARHSTNLLAVLVASTLAGCCCCPPLSCRYGDPGCPAAPAMAEGDCGGCGRGCGKLAGLNATDQSDHCQHGGHWSLFAHGPWLHEPVPSKQHFDYVSPTPKYHPVPTRPVFEPQPEYPPPHQLAGPEPRRTFLHKGHVLPLHHQQALYQDAPYQQTRPLRGRDEPTPAQPPQ